MIGRPPSASPGWRPSTPTVACIVVPITFVLAGDTLYSAVDAKAEALADPAPHRERAGPAGCDGARRPLRGRLDAAWWLRLRGRARVLDGGEEAERRSPRS